MAWVFIDSKGKIVGADCGEPDDLDAHIKAHNFPEGTVAREGTVEEVRQFIKDGDTSGRKRLVDRHEVRLEKRINILIECLEEAFEKGIPIKKGDLKKMIDLKQGVIR